MSAFCSGDASSLLTLTTPTSSLKPQCITMERARRVACCRSLDAPDVTSSAPNTSSSATRPPINTSSLASIWRFDRLVWSPSGSCITIPKAWPRGMMVALCTGSAPGVLMAMRACPPSWNAVSFALSFDTTADVRSAPMKILSLACSNAAWSTPARPSTDALMAAMFTRLASEAPLMPGVPRASTSRFTSPPRGVFLVYRVRMSSLPCTSGRGTVTWRSKRPGLMSASSSTSA
mmetsp:Transcript_40658/g.82041  ORF Transcript_40658/g.82041 Transcript_40658/m.82041 type:complete len:233 (-) Transcript_40658:513-1211(-)